MARSKTQRFTVGEYALNVSNLDKVLYPATGTTKADVIHYYLSAADALIAQAAWRPVTRKRWVNGVGTAEAPGQVFFRKDIEDGAPDWVPTGRIAHKDHTNTYPLANNAAVLAWFAQLAALEIHVPQWRFGADGAPRTPDRLVTDVTFRLTPTWGVLVRAEFTCPDARTIVMHITEGEGLGSVVETHATPLTAPGAEQPVSVMSEATIATSDRVGFRIARAFSPLITPLVRRTQGQLWVDDLEYAERRRLVQRGVVPL